MLISIQRLLDFEGCTNPQFSRADGLGRVGVAGFLTGIVFGVHLSIAGCCLAINGLVLSRLVRQGGERQERGGGWAQIDRAGRNGVGRLVGECIRSMFEVVDTAACAVGSMKRGRWVQSGA